jgi:lysophospholipase L1-like esterase
MPAGRFVAIGDSFTEGVGDWDDRYPNGVRGWADRVANQLGKADPTWQYANLALRSRTIDEVVDGQLDLALAMDPTLVSFFAGGNDLLHLRADVDWVLSRIEQAAERIGRSGARLMLFTTFDIRLSPVLEPLRTRSDQLNRRVRQIAVDHGAILIDHQAMRAYEHPRMWEPDRLHMSHHGHRFLARAVLAALGYVDTTITLRDLGSIEPSSWRRAIAAEREWWSEWLTPMLARRMRNERIGENLLPKWPELFHPATGMKKRAAQ